MVYLGILLLLGGWSLRAGSPLLAGYAAVLAVAFHLRVVSYEEPRLRSQFGEDWNRYAARAPRWLPWRRRR